MVLRHSDSTSAENPVKSSEQKSKSAGSFHKLSHSPAYKIYSLSFVTGKYTLKIADMIAGGFENVWRLTLSDAFDRVVDFFRRFTELKKSRVVRGDISITRGLFTTAARLSAFTDSVVHSFTSRGKGSGFRVVRGMFRHSIAAFWVKNRRVFNYLAPVAGMAVLALTIYLWSHVTLGVSVNYGGNRLGIIASEDVYTSAAKNVETKVTEASGASYTLSKSPVYKLELVQKSDLLNQDELYDNILRASSKDVKSGYGLYVDNRLVGSNDDSKAIQAMLDSITASYKADPKNDQVAFYQDVKIKAGVFPKSVERSTDNLKGILTASAKNATTYVAQKGDSPEMVANKYHISVDQLYAMNSKVQASDLVQGEAIQVVDSLPTLSVKYTRRETSTQAIPYAVVSQEAANIAKGRTVVTQNGQNGVLQVVSDVSYVGNSVVESKTVSTMMLKAPVNQEQKVGTFDYTAKANNLLGYAGNFVGSSYRSGASGPYSFDCSGYTMFVFSKFGISLPHDAAAQSSYGTPVSRGNLQPGDLVFFNTNGYGIGHVGIYAGNGEFVNAQNYNSGVTYASLSGYWSSTYVCARRLW